MTMTTDAVAEPTAGEPLPTVVTTKTVTTKTTGPATAPAVRGSEYSELCRRVQRAALLQPRPGWYFARIGVNIGLLAAGWVAFVLLGNSWWQLATAAYLAVIFTQLTFIGHDAGHRQIVASRHGNDAVGLLHGNLLVGLSYGWWVVNHHVASVRELAARRDRGAAVEGFLLLAHLAAYLTVVALVLSPVKAVAFVLLHQALFGLYLGCTFAPNHKGMPLAARDEADFLRRQVLTARRPTPEKRLATAIDIRRGQHGASE